MLFMAHLLKPAAAGGGGESSLPQPGLLPKPHCRRNVINLQGDKKQTPSALAPNRCPLKTQPIVLRGEPVYSSHTVRPHLFKHELMILEDSICMKFWNWIRDSMVTELRKWLGWGTKKRHKVTTMF